MKQLAKRWLHKVLAQSLLRDGTTRTVPWGDYRGLRFYMSPPMRSRLSVFYRAYEPEVTAWLRDTVKPGMTVYVLGGHVGIHVLYIASLLADRGDVVAFEGWPENFASLSQNVKANPTLRPRIELVEAAVTNQFGTVRMVQGSSDGKHAVAAAPDAGRTIDVSATTLDDFQSTQTQCPDMILMDIEGHEGAALQGAQQLLPACKPTLLLEHHGQADALTQQLAAFNYTVTRLDNRHIIAQ